MVDRQRLLLSNFTWTFLLYIIFYPSLIYSQYTAIIQFEYYNASSNYSSKVQENNTNGIISSKSNRTTIPKGPAFTFISVIGKYDGCHPPARNTTYPNGIAIIQRGGVCTFSVKTTRAKLLGAKAAIIYDPGSNGVDLFDIYQNNSDVLALYAQRSIGYLLFRLVNDSNTHLNISLYPVPYNYDDSNGHDLWYGSQGAIVFIVVSICILVCSCVSWFIFYFLQRRRLNSTKNRLENRLIHAAKKALNKIPIVTINGNVSAEESCVVCLDSIKEGDVVREILCGHRFHQTCVDPWLINRRHCPLCNLDILTAYHIPVPEMPRDDNSAPPENPLPSHFTSLATTAAIPILELSNLDHDGQQQQQQQQQQQVIIHTQPDPLPSISASVKDNTDGEYNPSFRSENDR